MTTIPPNPMAMLVSWLGDELTTTDVVVGQLRDGRTPPVVSLQASGGRHMDSSAELWASRVDMRVWGWGESGGGGSGGDGAGDVELWQQYLAAHTTLMSLDRKSVTVGSGGDAVTGILYSAHCVGGPIYGIDDETLWSWILGVYEIRTTRTRVD